MSSSSRQVNKFKQEIAPKDGYKILNTARVCGRRLSPKVWYSAGLLATISLLYDVKRIQKTKQMIANSMMEMDEGRICIEPILWAEVDRMNLIYMRKARDEENRIMKDVPGWVTGTWMGEPIYKTRSFFPVYGKKSQVPHSSPTETFQFTKDFYLHT
ncbi:hypothetical protein GJ496_009640 [Pomphorhynchus laevis]|nr:hypothetical protein GJ496_009640 [Pomphorhynchus laevis]